MFSRTCSGPPGPTARRKKESLVNYQAPRFPVDEEQNAVLSAQLLDKMQQHLNPALARICRLMGIDSVEWDAEGAVVRDLRGKPLIDCSSSYGAVNMGHRHPKIMAAVRDQLERMSLSTRGLINRPQIELAARLAELTPGDLQYTFFGNSGTEAVEAALKLARAYTGKPGVIAALNSFHGKTFGSLSATASPVYRHPFEPLVPGFTFVPFGDEGALEKAIGEDTGTVILEPVQGEAGVRIPPDGYLRKVREICDRYGLTLIIDEVQTGLGRTGWNFACQREDVVPDLMTLAKSLGGGIMPLGAVVARPRYFAPFEEHPFIHSSTLGGNPLACSAGLAALAVLEEEGLAAGAAAKGKALLAGLQQVAREYPDVVTEVRGRGLMCAVEFAEGAGGIVLSEMFNRGVFLPPGLNDWTVIRVMPPLVITHAQLETVIQALGESVAVARQELSYL